jgi:hypothetical protein
MIKAAQTTEWKLHGWKLGSLPGNRLEGIGYTPPPPERTVMGTASGYFLGRSLKSPMANIRIDTRESNLTGSVWDLAERTKSARDQGSRSPVEPSRPPVSPLTRPKSVASKLVRRLSKTSLGPSSSLNRLSGTAQIDSTSLAIPCSGLSSPGASSTLSAGSSHTASSSSQTIEARRPIPDRSTSLPSLMLNRESSRAASVASSASSSGPLVGESSLATAILRASHAEALQGATSDLLAILGKDSKEWGFSYTHISHACHVWLGEKDDKIGQRGARWMEREMKACRVDILSGEGHNLLSSGSTMLKVFGEMQKDVWEWKRSQAL